MPILSKYRGFTLIELLVTLFIVVLVISMGTPALRSFSARNQVTANSNRIVSGLNIARSEAAKRSNSVTICTSKNGSSCTNNVADWDQGWMVFEDNDGDGIRDAGDEILRVDTYSSSSVSSNGGNGALTFSSSGTLNTNINSTSIEICYENLSVENECSRLNILRSGTVSTEKFDG